MIDDLWVVLPLIWLALGGFALALIARLWCASNEVLAALTTGVCAVALGLMIPPFVVAREAALTGAPMPTWGVAASGGVVLRATPGALALSAVSLGLGLCTAWYSGRYMSRDPRYASYYPLLPLLLAALMGMVMTTDLFNLYLFCELMSIASYVLVAFRRHTDTAIEAGFKYLILGSVATLVMLLGIASIYRETGGIALPVAATTAGPWLRIGQACFLVGLGLKSGIVPLHTWLPDAYGRAPSSVSALLAGIVSKSTLYVLFRVSLGLGMQAETLGLILLLFSFLNMTVGNALALLQRYTKRLLAYSSVAQTGYVMFAVGLGLRYGRPAAIRAGFFLLLAHAVLKALAFLSKGVCHYHRDVTLTRELRGTAAQIPLVAVTFAVALIGLAGIPPLAGFAAKWWILTESLPAPDGWAAAGIVIFLVNSVLALGYYLPLIVRLFDNSGAEGGRIPLSVWMSAPLLLLGALALAIGFQPGPWLGWAEWLTFF
jgi:proton-translocating NADH-quinone oxidoreductase chain N